MFVRDSPPFTEFFAMAALNMNTGTHQTAQQHVGSWQLKQRLNSSASRSAGQGQACTRPGESGLIAAIGPLSPPAHRTHTTAVASTRLYSNIELCMCSSPHQRTPPGSCSPRREGEEGREASTNWPQEEHSSKLLLLFTVLCILLCGVRNFDTGRTEFG